MQPKVKIINAALDELDDGSLLLRGVIDPGSLRHLKIGPYQRGVLSEKKILELMAAHRSGGVNDIDLGMRGFRTEDEDNGRTFYLLDPVFIIDGQQRWTAGIRVMDDDPPVLPHIGAAIRFGTDVNTERALFKVLNLKPTKLSPNVVLRNEKDEGNAAIAELFRLTHNQTFPLRNRVQWGQTANKTELITATVYVQTVGRLHSHFGYGRGTEAVKVARGLDGILRQIGKPAFVANVQAFFELMEECWGLSNVEFRGATFLKGSFLMTLAAVLSDHEDFWTGDRLTIPGSLGLKIGRFSIKDPQIMQLAGSGGMARKYLYKLLVDHINSGKRTKQLRPRNRAGADLPEATPAGES